MDVEVSCGVVEPSDGVPVAFISCEVVAVLCSDVDEVELLFLLAL